jgi:hypothetical protein
MPAVIFLIVSLKPDMVSHNEDQVCHMYL